MQICFSVRSLATPAFILTSVVASGIVSSAVAQTAFTPTFEVDYAQYGGRNPIVGAGSVSFGANNIPTAGRACSKQGYKNISKITATIDLSGLNANANSTVDFVNASLYMVCNPDQPYVQPVGSNYADAGGNCVGSATSCNAREIDFLETNGNKLTQTTMHLGNGGSSAPQRYEFGYTSSATASAAASCFNQSLMSSDPTNGKIDLSGLNVSLPFTMEADFVLTGTPSMIVKLTQSGSTGSPWTIYNSNGGSTSGAAPGSASINMSDLASTMALGYWITPSFWQGYSPDQYSTPSMSNGGACRSDLTSNNSGWQLKNVVVYAESAFNSGGSTGSSQRRRGDMDNSGHIDAGDLGLMLMGFGDCLDNNDCIGDINRDGKIDFDDLGRMLLVFGESTSNMGTGWTTDGNQIVDPDGNYARLTGVNFTGLETALSGQYPGGQISQLWLSDSQVSYTKHLDQIKSYGFNCLRVPFSVQAIQSTQPTPGTINRANNPLMWNDSTNQQKTPLQCLDEVVKYAGSIGLKIILDCHSSIGGAYQSEPVWFIPGDATYTEQNWKNTWTTLATRYGVNWSTYDPYQAVIACDLFNEPKGNPYGTIGGIPFYSAWTAIEYTTSSASVGGTSQPVSWNYAAQSCGTAILDVFSNAGITPRWLIMVEGTEVANTTAKEAKSGGGTYTWWGGNLSAVRTAPIVMTEYPNKVVYSTHDYPETVDMESQSGVCTYIKKWWPAYNNCGGNITNYPHNLDDQAWDSYWGFIATENIAPVYIGEFGSYLSDTSNYSSTMTNYGIPWVSDDKLWIQALLNYMVGDFDLTLGTINGIPSSNWPNSIAPISFMGNNSAGLQKKGVNFTYFQWAPNSEDSGGILSNNAYSPVQEKMNFLASYLDSLLTQTLTP